METFSIIFIFCLVCGWLFKRWHDRHSILLGLKIPSNKFHLIMGFGHVVNTKDCIQTLFKDIQKYGKNVVIYMGPYPALLTADPVVIKDVLTSKQCVKKAPFVYEHLSHAIGRGLITLNPPDWYTDRKMLNTAFNNKNLMSFMPIFNEASKNLLGYIDRDMQGIIHAPLIDHFRRFTVEIAVQTTIGRDMNKLNISDYRFRAIAGALEYTSEATFNCWLFIGIIRKLAELTVYKESIYAINFMQTFIAESLNGFAANREVDPSYVLNIKTSMDYMSNGIQKNTIDRKYAVDGLFHIFIGAFETTSTSLYFTLIMLAMHPEYQKRAYEEVCTIFPDKDDNDEEFEVTHEDLNQLVYLDMIINETMRVLPIIPLVGRIVSERNLELSNGITLPKGQSVLIDIYNLHRSKEIWGPNAEKFNPDNFLPSNIEMKPSYAFIPFTKGVRFCIGMRYVELILKLALVKLINRYSFSTTAKLEDLKVENHITTQLSKHPPLTIQRREKAKSHIL